MKLNYIFIIFSMLSYSYQAIGMRNPEMNVLEKQITNSDADRKTKKEMRKLYKGWENFNAHNRINLDNETRQRIINALPKSIIEDNPTQKDKESVLVIPAQVSTSTEIKGKNLPKKIRKRGPRAKKLSVNQKNEAEETSATEEIDAPNNSISKEKEAENALIQLRKMYFTNKNVHLMKQLIKESGIPLPGSPRFLKKAIFNTDYSFSFCHYCKSLTIFHNDDEINTNLIENYYSKTLDQYACPSCVERCMSNNSLSCLIIEKT